MEDGILEKKLVSLTCFPTRIASRRIKGKEKSMRVNYDIVSLTDA